jgi:beta-glucosidase
MTSYNIINGYHASTNKDLLTHILREEWGYDGMVTTDWWTAAEHHREVMAGNDLRMPSGYMPHLHQAMAQGLITRAALETAARHILTMILRID